MRLLTKKTRAIVISITSLIDVVLLLLIFFMLTTSFVEQPGMKLDLPEMQSGENQKVSELLIQIEADNSIFINRSRIEFSELESKISEIAKTIFDKSLHLEADKNVSHGTVVKVLDTAKICGIEKIVIISKKKSKN